MLTLTILVEVRALDVVRLVHNFDAHRHIFDGLDDRLEVVLGTRLIVFAIDGSPMSVGIRIARAIGGLFGHGLLAAPTTTTGLARRRGGRVAIIIFVIVIGVGQRLLHRLRAVVDIDAGSPFDHILEPKLVTAIRRQNIADVQEPVDTTSERHERRPNGRLDVDDFALVDVTEIRLSVGQLDVQLLQHAIFHHRDPAFFRIDGVDEHPLHGGPLLDDRRELRRPPVYPKI